MSYNRRIIYGSLIGSGVVSFRDSHRWEFRINRATLSHKLRNSLFDLYLLDNRLPDMNGLDLIKEIRAFDARTPIVLASADAREEEQDRALACGAQAYVTKPWEPDFLVATVRNLTHQSELRAIEARLAETTAILQQIEDHRAGSSSPFFGHNACEPRRGRHSSRLVAGMPLFIDTFRELSRFPANQQKEEIRRG